ncbi:MAG: alpha/beta hydrolase [Deltaproteobacteria bacterium]|nr:alpha/beta hydrolase [Deltaproteobacteria bacterium]
MEERIFVESQGLKIEGIFDKLPGEKSALVTHPHPLFGGNMNNNVVESIVQAYKDNNYSTLKFNFRGVGQSEGTYDQGVGEVEDVRACINFLHEQGKSCIQLGGYSFGAWVNARGLDAFPHIDCMIMISPPVQSMDFSFLNFSPEIELVITASEDDIAPPSIIERMLPAWNPEARFKIINGGDHFYWGKTAELKGIINEYLRAKT